MAAGKSTDELPEIPGFRLLKPLGRGGMAQVFLAMQESMDREVAIKIMLPQLLTDPSFGDRFLREARIAAKLAHPNIVAVIDVGQRGDLFYMAMEFHPGGDLKDKIRKGLGVKEAVRIMKEIASALDYAHKNGFVHRDIKPDNILFSRSGSAVLSDFGIARAADGSTHLTATGSVVGTPHYMSPEQAQGKPVDGRSDLYSLGIMFYQMLVGAVPFDGDSALSIGIKHIRDAVPDLPPRLAKYQGFLNKLLEKDPANRWQTGADVVRALEILETSSGDSALAATMAATAINAEAIQATQAMGAISEPKNRTGVMVAVALVLLGAGGGGYYLIGQKSETPAPAVTIAPEASVPAKVEEPPQVASISPAPAPAPVPKPAPVAKPAPAPRAAPAPTPVAPKVDTTQQKVDAYVTDANDYLAPSRLSEPRLDQAARLYRSAAQLAPNDAGVKRLPDQIAGGFQILADEKRVQKDWSEAKRLASKGLAVVAGHRGLTALVAQIDTEQSAENKPKTRRAFGGF